MKTAEATDVASLANAGRGELALLEQNVAAAELAAADALRAYQSMRPRSAQLKLASDVAGDDCADAREALELARQRLQPVFDAEQRAAQEAELAALLPRLSGAAIEDVCGEIAALLAEFRSRLAEEVHDLDVALAAHHQASDRAGVLARSLRRPMEFRVFEFRRVIDALNDTLARKNGHDPEYSRLVIGSDPPRGATVTIHTLIP